MNMDDDEEERIKRSPLEEKMEILLLDKRRIFLSSSVDENSARDIIRKLWYLEYKDPGKPILFVINSPGGSVDSGFAIWDQIKLISSPITTLITGLAASMGSVLSLAAPPGRRFATENSRIMIHQPAIHGVIRGQATDLEIQAKEIIKTRNAIVQIYTEATGQDMKVIEKALDRDTWMSPIEAQKFGLIDGIITSYAKLDLE